MTLAEVIALINSDIVPNGNNEITANVLRPILIEMLQQPNDLIGELDELNTVENDTLVKAINSVNNALSDVDGLTILSGQGDPNGQSFPSLSIADLYSEIDGLGSPLALWIYDGTKFIRFSDKYLSYEIPQSLTPTEQLTARNNINATDRRLEELASDLTANERAKIRQKISAVSIDDTQASDDTTYSSNIIDQKLNLKLDAEDLSALEENKADKADVVPYTGADKTVNFNTQTVQMYGLATFGGINRYGGFETKSPWLDAGAMSSENNVSWIIIDGFNSGSNRQLSIEVDTISGNGARNVVTKRFIIDFNLSNIVTERYSGYTRVEGSDFRHGIGGVEKHSNNAIKIPIIHISSIPRLASRVTVKAWTGSINHLDFSTELASVPELTTELPVNSYLDYNNFVNTPNLSDYALSSQVYTKTESLGLFVGQNGSQTIYDTKTFDSAPIVPNGTLDGHTVNLGQLNTKANTDGSNTTGGTWNVDALANNDVGNYVSSRVFSNAMIGVPSTDALGSTTGVMLMGHGSPIAIYENDDTDWDGYIYRAGTPLSGYPANQQNGNYLIESKHRFRLHEVTSPDSTSGGDGFLTVKPFNAIEHSYYRVTISGVELLAIDINPPNIDELTGFAIERNAIGQKCTVAVSGSMTGVKFSNVPGAEWNKGVFTFYWTGDEWIFGGYSPIEP